MERAAMVKSMEPTSLLDEPAVSDHELMLAVRDGEIGRMGELFKRHQRPLYSFFVRLTNNRSASEDLVQMVFYRILKYRHTYRGEGKFTSWIYHVARRAVVDHYRQSSRAGDPGPAEALDLIPDQGPDASDATAAKDELDLMQQAFQQLPLEQREILVLFRFQEMPHRDIAQLLGCSVGAVKVRVHRALGALREKYFALQKKRPA